ncbi:MAG TPA: hypothetical protein VHX65_09750 [Pirellulales bacterium]|nr:hypothetical protein [Pirellulales bacterium]
MKEEVGRSAPAAKRIHSASIVAENEFSDGRLSVGVQNVKLDCDRRRAVEEHVDFTAEAKVLRSLACIEFQLCLALAGVAAEKLDNAVFDFQTRKRLVHRLTVERLYVEPTVSDVRLIDRAFRNGRAAGHTFDRRGIRASNVEHGFRARVIVDLDQKYPPALLREPFRRGSGDRFDSPFWIDFDFRKTKRIEKSLDLSHAGCLIDRRTRLLKRFPTGLVERRPGNLQSLNNPLNLCSERLQIDIARYGQ